MNRSEMAGTRARAAWSRGLMAPVPERLSSNVIVLGDPQASLACLFTHLDAQQVLTEDGWLRPDVGLICVGDYFDFAAEDSDDAGYQGAQFLAWLAAHDSAQTTLLMGNHDVERVMSFAGCTSERYRESQAACRKMLLLQTPEARRAFREDWVAAHSDHPPMVAAHDYRSFVPAQSDMMRRLLLQGRMTLATTAMDASGRTILITHAGVTRRELDLVGASANPLDCALRLNRFLADAVDRVRSAWTALRHQPLDLSPLYHGWEHHRPNGGLLIHRPDGRSGTLTHEQTLGLDAPRAPRSVPPAEFLIPDLHQVVGHTVACQRLVRWLEPRVSASAQAAPIGRLLCLVSEGPQHTLVLPTETQNAASSVVFADVGLAVCEVGTADFFRLQRLGQAQGDSRNISGS